MRHRVDAGTDRSMIGAWDAACAPFTHADATFEAEVRAGRLFLMDTCGDGGGFVDVYVDEDVPSDVAAKLRAHDGEWLLRVPSGRLAIGGVELHPDRPGVGLVEIAAGDYGVRCFAPIDPDGEQPDDPAALRRALVDLVGAADLAHYDRMNRAGCLTGVASLLLFPVLAFAVGWPIALPVTVVACFAWFALHEQLMRKNRRFARTHAAITAFPARSEEPVVVLELRSGAGSARLQGGSVELFGDRRTD